MFARHYLRNLGWFLFLRVLRWFSSPGSLLQSYVFRLGYTLLCGFPHSDIAVSMLFCQLHHAFRRLTRPSSPIIAKASTWCTYSLDSIIWSTLLTWEVRRWLATFLKVSTLIKLTACCVWFLPFVFRNHSIQSSPKYCLIGFFSWEERCFLLMEFIKVATLMFSNQSTLSLFVDFGFPIC